jgi:hypothetical protein
MEERKFSFGRYNYNYFLFREKRGTVSLTVMPDLIIFLKCPLDYTEDKIESFLKKKWFWLEKQINFFKKFKKEEYIKEYISGESFYYLGRQYKLIIQKSTRDKVGLINGKLQIFTTKEVHDSGYNKKILEEWYEKRRKIVFQERLEKVLRKFDYKRYPKLVIRRMNKRWGSFLGEDKIILNKLLICAPKECIDYVITHELCHFKYKNHNKNFYNLLESKFSNWGNVKEKLERNYGKEYKI